MLSTKRSLKNLIWSYSVAGQVRPSLPGPFSGEGKRLAVIDRKYIGGSCPNIACLPSKNIIHSAKVASYFRRSREFGISHDGFKIEMSGVRDRKRKMVSRLNEMYLENYRETGAEFILGTGRFIAPKSVEAILSDGTST
jgi:pyruvate/2-oxoglutarate dehydrogenase complex dihydrolipoamide dehydrogenase (E3) component